LFERLGTSFRERLGASFREGLGASFRAGLGTGFLARLDASQPLPQLNSQLLQNLFGRLGLAVELSLVLGQRSLVDGDRGELPLRLPFLHPELALLLTQLAQQAVLLVVDDCLGSHAGHELVGIVRDEERGGSRETGGILVVRKRRAHHLRAQLLDLFALLSKVGVQRLQPLPCALQPNPRRVEPFRRDLGFMVEEVDAPFRLTNRQPQLVDLVFGGTRRWGQYRARQQRYGDQR